jgi:hypothetical protein
MTPFTSQELRKGFASFATGVTVITCLDEENNPHGITINSFLLAVNLSALISRN